MAVVTVRLARMRKHTVIECHDRLCSARDPNTGNVCEGAGSHLGPHGWGARVGQSGVKWPNERVRPL